MAITTQAKRNSALIDECGILIPNGVIDAEDRSTLVGQYGGIAAPAPPETDITQGDSVSLAGDLFRRITRQWIR